jgi:hypothetical protein
VEEAKKNNGDREEREREAGKTKALKHKTFQGARGRVVSVHECFDVCKQVSTTLNTRNL